jgi:hypothetical protein
LTVRITSSIRISHVGLALSKIYDWRGGVGGLSLAGWFEACRIPPTAKSVGFLLVFV